MALKKIIACLAFSTIILLAGFLPALNASIININAEVNNVANPITLDLMAGIWELTPVGPPDGLFTAYALWSVSSLNCTDPNGCARTNPTTNKGWLNSFRVTSDFITSVSVAGSALAPIATPPGTFTSFFIDSPTEDNYFHVQDGMVWASAMDALNNAQSVVFTLAESGTILLDFAIVDGILADNAGGISLDINQVPIPSAVWLLGVGLVGLVGLRRKSVRKS